MFAMGNVNQMRPCKLQGVYEGHLGSILNSHQKAIKLTSQGFLLSLWFIELGLYKTNIAHHTILITHHIYVYQITTYKILMILFGVPFNSALKLILNRFTNYAVCIKAMAKKMCLVSNIFSKFWSG